MHEENTKRTQREREENGSENRRQDRENAPGKRERERNVACAIAPSPALAVRVGGEFTLERATGKEEGRALRRQERHRRSCCCSRCCCFCD
jgi:hypothetical protein